MTIIRKFQQNKLWRDKAPALMEVLGSVIHIKQLTDAEYDAALRLKLAEETAEVCAKNDTQGLTEELADLYEVIDALCALHSISKETLLEIQTKKRNERGGFYNRAYVTVAEHQIGSCGEQYCLEQPDKYPEIV